MSSRSSARAPKEQLPLRSSHNAGTKCDDDYISPGRGLISLYRRQFAAGKIAVPCCWPEIGRFQNKFLCGSGEDGAGKSNVAVEWSWWLCSSRLVGVRGSVLPLDGPRPCHGPSDPVVFLSHHSFLPYKVPGYASNSVSPSLADSSAR